MTTKRSPADDIREAMKQIEALKVPFDDVVAVECSPVDLKALEDVFVKADRNEPCSRFDGIKVTYNTTLPQGMGLGRNWRGEVVGWFDRNGWHRAELHLANEPADDLTPDELELDIMFFNMRAEVKCRKNSNHQK